MASFALLVFTDGRGDCLRRSLESAALSLPLERFDQRIVIDDSADAGHAALVDELAPQSMFTNVHHDSRQGFGGAIRSGWSKVWRDVDYVFHLEDDFVFNEPVDLDGMARLLASHPHLAQVVLLRQPWNAAERAAGGIMQQHPDDYTTFFDGNSVWTEHRRFFTTNPSLYRRALIERGWPTGSRSEGIFSLELAADPALRFAFWGGYEEAPRVTHIGQSRIGIGY